MYFLFVSNMFYFFIYGLLNTFLEFELSEFQMSWNLLFLSYVCNLKRKVFAVKKFGRHIELIVFLIYFK